MTATHEPTKAATATLSAATPVPTSGGAAGWNVATFLSDITISDGTFIPPEPPIKRYGRCKTMASQPGTASMSWSFSPAIRWAPRQHGLWSPTRWPWRVGPHLCGAGCPLEKGDYVGFFKIRSPDGSMFGVGADNKPLYVEINVDNKYYFLNNLCSASWTANDNLLYCPQRGRQRRWILSGLSTLNMENSIPANPSLVMVPPLTQNSQIVGRFNPIRIFSGARLQSLVGCQFGYEQCKVMMKITYTTEDGTEIPWPNTLNSMTAILRKSISTCKTWVWSVRTSASISMCKPMAARKATTPSGSTRALLNKKTP